MKLSDLKKLVVLLTVALSSVALNGVFVERLSVQGWFSETGYPSNLARVHLLQNASEVDVVLVGSSITGRLLPSSFEPSVGSVLNLGIDGGGVSTALEILLASDLQSEVVIVETNALRNHPTSSGQVVIDAQESASFSVSEKLPWLQPLYRPSSVFYTFLKRKKDNGGQTLRSGIARYDSVKEVDLEYVDQLLTVLFARFEQVIFVTYPSSSRPSEVVIEKVKEIASSQSGVSFVNLTEKLKSEDLLFTDQVHLSLGSAKKVCVELGKVLRESEGSLDH